MKTNFQPSPKHLGARSALVLFLIGLALVAIPGEAALTNNGNPNGGGVIGFLRGLEEEVHLETAWLYRHFGKNVDPAKIKSAQNCYYGNNKSMDNCAPAINPHPQALLTS